MGLASPRGASVAPTNGPSGAGPASSLALPGPTWPWSPTLMRWSGTPLVVAASAAPTWCWRRHASLGERAGSELLRAAAAQQLCSTHPHEPPRASPPALVERAATHGPVVGAVAGI